MTDLQEDIKQASAERQPVSKRTRFEVFKRDSFQCQYCGANAPQVLLHVDHIEPVAKGGTNEITNLITSCEACNNGKSDKLLSDDTAIAKSKRQMDALQDRRDQLELMMEWQKGLRSIDDDLVGSLAAYWSEQAPGWEVSDNGRRILKKLTLRFSSDEICRAMDAAAITYLKLTADGTASAESWDAAFAKIGGICRVNKASQLDPDIREMFYIRGILRKRIPGYFDPGRALQYLKNARSWGVSVNELREIATTIRNWSQFTAGIADAITQHKDSEGDAP